MELHERLGSTGRLRFVEHRGVPILLSDLSGLDGEELGRELDRGISMVQQHPPDSLLVLVKVDGIPYSLENVARLRHAAVVNRPFVRARAVVGLPDIARFSFRVIAQASRRSMEPFPAIDAALDWLADQA